MIKSGLCTFVVCTGLAFGCAPRDGSSAGGGLGEHKDASARGDVGGNTDTGAAPDLGENKDTTAGADLGAYTDSSTSPDLGQGKDTSASRDLGERKDAQASAEAGGRPALHISNGSLRDGHDNRVLLRGVNTEGIANIIAFRGGQTGLAKYIDRATQTDADGKPWYSTAIRLNFERYPCTDSARLYQAGDERLAYTIPDTAKFEDWMTSMTATEGEIRVSGTGLFIASKRTWAADRGQAWNPGHYEVGDLVVGLWNAVDPDFGNRVYKCTAFGKAICTDWGGGPKGSSTTAQTDCQGNTWVYVGDWGASGTTPLDALTAHHDGAGDWYVDNLTTWRYVSKSYDSTEAETRFAKWMTDVLDPAVQHAVDKQLYAIITDFDFGSADHPLRKARMLDFWDRISKSRWANHPQVLFDLWNESSDVGGFKGWTWPNQKPHIQATVDKIRGNGANNIVIVTTPAFCAYTDLATSDPLTGTNIAYDAHHYDEYYSGNAVHFQTALASGQAVILSEWGPIKFDDATATASFIKTLRQTVEPSDGAAHPAIGWLAWALTDSWTPDLYDSTLTKPTAFGLGTRQWLEDVRADSQPVP